MLKIGVSALVFILCLSAPGFAQTFWVASDGSAALQLQTYSGSVPVALTPVTLSSRISVLVHLSSLTPPEWDLAQTRIRSLVTTARQSGGLNIYVISDTGVLSWLQVKNVSQYQADFKKLSPPVNPISAESAWSELAESIPDAIEPFGPLFIFAAPADIQNAALKSYADAYISRRARTRGFRVFHWATIAAEESSLWKSLTSVTCGADLPADFELKELPAVSATPCATASFSTPPVSLGVYPYVGRLSDTLSGSEVASVPLLNVANGWQPIRIDAYTQMLKSFGEAESALAANDAQAVQSSLETALKINPMYPPALRFGIDLYKRQKDWETALSLLSPLSDVTAPDSGIWSEIGEMNFNLKRWDRSEKAYIRSIELKANQPAVLEQLAIVRENQGDKDGAQNYLGRVLTLTPARVDLHTRRGDLLTQLNRSSEAAKEFEESLKLDSELDDIRIHVIGIYANLHARDEIRRHLQARAASVPADLKVRMNYAGLASGNDLQEDALTYFKLALDIDKSHEPGHFGMASTLVKLNKAADALAAAADGLKVSPSIRLHLMKFDLLDSAGRLDDSRTAIEDAFAADEKDAEVLKRYARVMDVFANKAADAYFRLSAALLVSHAPESERRQALDRGLDVAVRDGEPKLANAFREALAAAGDAQALKKPAGPATEGTTIVPGGIRALATVALIPQDVSADRFALEFSQALVNNGQGGKKAAEKYIESLLLYFETLEKLKKLMTPSSAGLDAVLETTRQGFDKAGEILKLFGWRMDRQRNRIVLEMGTDKDEAERQTFSGSFGIDFLAMKQDLEGGKSFKLHVPYDTIPIAIDEPFWYDKVMDAGKLPGGLFERLLDHLPAARLYIALATITPETRQQLLKNVNAERLAKRFSTILTFYGSSLSINGGEIELPGGKAASAAWEKLAGTSPARTGQFLNVLLEKDDGKLLAYFHTLFHLPLQNQRFFARTPQRLSAFYKAFPFSDKSVLEHNLLVRRNSDFFDLLRELPLDADSSIVFPGSDQVWMVAKGTSSPDDVGKMLKRVRKAVAPDVEDKILLDILDTHYDIDGVQHNQSENFLAVVRLEKHRAEPMDEVTALTLAQNYNKYRALFPYLSSMPELNSNNLLKFFKTARLIEQIDKDRIDQMLAQFHGILSLLNMLSEVHALKESETVSILMTFCDGFATAKEPWDYAKNTLDAIQRIVGAIPGEGSDSADTRLLNVLAGASSEISFRSEQQFWSVSRAEWQKKRMSGVLAAQTATPIQVLLNAYSGAQTLIAAKGDPQEAIRVLEQESPKLLELTARPEDKLSDKDRDFLIQGNPRELANLIAKIKKESVKKDRKSIGKIAGDYIEQLLPYLKTTLTAWTYARYAAPDDLVIAEDRYFVRRHSYLGRFEKSPWFPTEVRFANANSGMYLQGGLAQIASAAGQWGQNRSDAENSIRSDGPFEFTSRGQLAALRSVPWVNVSTAALHLAGLQLRTGRELLVAAARDESLRRTISERLMGLVGNFRRLAINRALIENDAEKAIDLLSASDLYFLVDAMKQDIADWKTASPLIAEFRKQKNNPAWSQVDNLGGIHPHTYGCVHPHLIPLGPYEEYERILLREPMSERLSDVLLSAAEIADREGIPSDALAVLSESLLRELATSTTMSDSDDWLAAVHAMHRMDLARLLPELERLSR